MHASKTQVDKRVSIRLNVTRVSAFENNTQYVILKTENDTCLWKQKMVYMPLKTQQDVCLLKQNMIQILKYVAL